MPSHGPDQLEERDQNAGQRVKPGAPADAGRRTRIRRPNDRLAEHRLSRGWTQEELAVRLAAYTERSGIDADYISRLERGVIAWPNDVTRHALESLFETTAWELGFVNRRLGGHRRSSVARHQALTGLQ